MRFIKPDIFDCHSVVSAVSTRNGGVSLSPYDSLNMGKSTKDNPEHVLENRRLFFSDLGIDESKVALSYQVHGSEILRAESPCKENGYDALVTDKKGLFLVVSIADCTPVLFHDPIKKVVAAAHAGWRGTAAGIVVKTLNKMIDDYGCDPKDVRVFIGPCIGFAHFETGEEVALQFDGNLRRYDALKKKYFVDLKSANRQQALENGVLPEHVETSGYCTFQDEKLFFSHRRDKGLTGRMVAVIGMY